MAFRGNAQRSILSTSRKPNTWMIKWRFSLTSMGGRLLTLVFTIFFYWWGLTKTPEAINLAVILTVALYTADTFFFSYLPFSCQPEKRNPTARERSCLVPWRAGFSADSFCGGGKVGKKTRELAQLRGNVIFFFKWHTLKRVILV